MRIWAEERGRESNGENGYLVMNSNGKNCWFVDNKYLMFLWQSALILFYGNMYIVECLELRKEEYYVLVFCLTFN